MRRLHLALALAPAVCGLAAAALASGDAARPEAGLRPVAELAAIADPAERARALFTEAGRVLRHPRCLNCHPSGDSPLQGEDGRLHQPPVRRGRGGMGVVGMRCRTCHMKQNYDPGRVPGASPWILAPRKMGWEGLSLGEICAQLKDPERNGGRTLDEIVAHMAEDHLVGWAWHPGAGREPPPGTQRELGELFSAWVEAGADCP